MSCSMGLQARQLPSEGRAFHDFFVLTQKHFAHRISFIPVLKDAQLAALKMPLLAIVGARDVAFHTAKSLRRLQTHVPHAQIICRPDVGHGMLDYAGTLLDFFRGHGRG